jgi:hypothetical protein
MRRISRLLVGAGIASLLVAPALLAQTAAPDQTTGGCLATDWIGVMPNNPFTARRVSKSIMKSPNGTEKTMDTIEKIARDRDGRIRFEKHTRLPGDEEEVTLTTHEGESLRVTNQILKTSILIFDCSAGKTISILPGMHVAYIRENGSRPVPPEQKRPYTSPSWSLVGRNLPPNVSVQELGYREVEGVEARGLKVTTLGEEKDGDWSEKPVEIDETWDSVDLGATILQIQSSPKAGNERTVTLKNIRRGAPDPSLFEIPPAYKINPAPGELPSQRLDRDGIRH